VLLRGLAPALAVSALLAFVSVGTAASHPVLVGTTGPGYTIKVTRNGKAVKTLKAGTYSLVVHDKAAVHDFHLIGPGFNKRITSVSFVGTKTVTVTLKKGKYAYQCDPHAAGGMKGSFTVS
jgi:plastocyanin